jgi:hypothetical protein
MTYSNNGKGSATTSTIALLEKPSQPIDEFDSPAFEGSDQSLPYIQMLNQPDPAKAGFFITLENATAECGMGAAHRDLPTGRDCRWVSEFDGSDVGAAEVGVDDVRSRLRRVH